MKRFALNKLVGDNILNKLKKDRAIVKFKILSKEELLIAFKNKLIEEALEVSEETDKKELLIEIVDVLEVLDGLCKILDLSQEDILVSRNKKNSDGGAFTKGIYIKSVEAPIGSYVSNNCIKNPEKYPSSEKIEKGVYSFVFNKLVRDDTLEFFKKVGATPTYQILSKEEFISALKNKLIEEAKEVVEESSKQKLLIEIVDVLEILDGLCKILDLSQEEVAEARRIKNEDRGPFTNGVYIEYVDAPEDSYVAGYCSKNPTRYPELKKKRDN